MLLGGVLALLLAGSPTKILADDDDPPKAPRQPVREAVRRLERIRKMMEQQGMSPLDLPALRATGPEPRLGAEVAAPGGALADQLDLPRGQGLVVNRLGPNSPAGKAGVKKYDILLELNGKAVPSKASEFAKLLSGIKADAPVDVVVLRKGKKETIKGLKLPEAKAAAQPFGGGVRGLPSLPDFPSLPGFPNFPGFEGLGDLDKLLPPKAGGADVTTVTRNNDQFTVTRKEGRRTFQVTGKVDQGVAKVDRVTIDDGDGKKTYEGMDKVPAQHKKRVEDLAAMVVPANETETDF